MGTNVIFDLLGSFIIGGMLLVNLLNLQGNASSQSDLYSITRITQKNLVTTVSILENDFRKMGFGVPDPTKTIIYADSNKIIFQADIDRNKTLDTLTYYIGPVSELTSTPNPNDRYLYRVINKAKPLSANLGITRFSMKFYDQDLKPVTNVQAIKILEITISVESPFPLKNPVTNKMEYPSAFWKQTRISARNLSR
jgi:hypothetical protein